MEETSSIVKRTFKNIDYEYTELYHLDYYVNEDSGEIDKEKKVKYYTKEQVTHNLKMSKNAYIDKCRILKLKSIL